MEQETIFAEGFIFKKPTETAPEFVKGHLSIKVAEAIAFLQKYDNKNWVNIDMKKSKGGKLYLQLNTWKPENKEAGDKMDSPF